MNLVLLKLNYIISYKTVTMLKYDCVKVEDKFSNRWHVI